jgi:hypothetical protein
LIKANASQNTFLELLAHLLPHNGIGAGNFNQKFKQAIKIMGTGAFSEKRVFGSTNPKVTEHIYFSTASTTKYAYDGSGPMPTDSCRHFHSFAPTADV